MSMNDHIMKLTQHYNVKSGYKKHRGAPLQLAEEAKANVLRGFISEQQLTK
jgi:hypothetical protein